MTVLNLPASKMWRTVLLSGIVCTMSPILYRRDRVHMCMWEGVGE